MMLINRLQIYVVIFILLCGNDDNTSLQIIFVLLCGNDANKSFTNLCGNFYIIVW